MLLITLENICLFILLFDFYFASIPFNSNPDSSRDSTIFVVSSISSFAIVNAVVPEP